MSERCSSCAGWSELVARSIGGGPMEALCLVETSPYRDRYTTGGMGCKAWTNNPAFADHPSERAPLAKDRRER